MAETYDKRTGKLLREGTSIDYSGIKDPSMLKYDENTGNPMTSLSSGNLKNSGQQLTLPDPATPTYGGIPGATEGLVATEKTEAQKNVDRLKETANKSGEAYLKELLGSAGIPSSVDRTKEDAARVESDKYLAQLEQEQLSNRRAIESVQKNFQGTTAGLSDAISAINRKSLSTQADIAILQTTANRNYDTAKSIADRSVQMKLEESKIKLTALQFFYNENKENFTKADDRLYAEAVKKADSELRKQEEIENKIRDLKLNVAQFAGSNAAGILAKLSAIDSKDPKAFDKAAAIAGKYQTDPLDRQIKQATLNKLNTESSGSKVPNITKINGVDKQWDPKTGQWVEPSVAGASSTVDATVTEKSSDDLIKIKGLISNNTGISNSSGYASTNINPFTKTKVQDWRNNVKNILAQSTLAELVRVKGSGVTFGALSEGERQAVAAASTALNAAMIYEGEGDNKVATGRFTASEDFVKEQLGLIQKYAELDFLRRTGKTPDQYIADKYVSSIAPALNSVTSPYSTFLTPGQFNN